MPIQVVVVIAIAVVFAAIVLGRQARAWRKYRTPFVVTCPDNHEHAGVEVDARHAAATALLGSAELRLDGCSRWPEKAGCGQPCLSQIALSPQDCMVRAILTKWYEGKSCVFCGKPFEAVEWAQAKPAVLGPDRISVDWENVPAARVYETLATAQPVCFSCHTANTLVREHPELVADRSTKKTP